MVRKNTKHEIAIITDREDATDHYGYPVISSLEAAKRIAIIEGPGPAPDLLAQGLKWLGRWEVIAPFRPYDELAEDFVTSQEEIEQLKIGDLRVPVFDTRLIFIKPNNTTKKLWRIYKEEAEHRDSRIAFMIAVWETKPLIKPLPAGRWIK